MSMAICFRCQAVADTTEEVRDVTFADGTGYVPQIPVLVCSQCGEVVAIPAKSTPWIRAARGRLNSR
jgi:YgiT-type zinc finger domain-containing protein